MIRLKVFLNDVLVGHLTNDPQTNRFAFDYAPAWANDARSYGLSPRLPLEADGTQTAEQHSTEVRQFFENLLPEGEALDAVSVLHQVSKANLVGLLIHIGRDMAGALRVEIDSPVPSSALPAAAPSVLRPLSHEELSDRIRQRAQQPFAVWDGKVRMSVAGFQDKIVAFEHEGQWSFVESGPCASNVIIKPEPKNPRMAGMTGNEFMCMQLASAVGLPTARVQLKHIPEPVLVIERFDRETASDGSWVSRKHVIDGCQALGLSSGFKYERPYGSGVDVRAIRDGASLPKLFALMAHTAAPARQRQQLLQWVIFQVLIGNTDAHAKNVSFFCGSAGLELSPTYDLVCAPAFSVNDLEDEYAMAIGDAFKPEELTAFEWAEFAVQCGLQPRLVGSEIKKLCQMTKKVLPTIAEIAATHKVPDNIIAGVSTTVQAMCESQLRPADGIARVDPNLLSSA